MFTDHNWYLENVAKQYKYCYTIILLIVKYVYNCTQAITSQANDL